MGSPDAQEIVVDRSVCVGHGMCYGTSPDLIGYDEQGDPIMPGRALKSDEFEAARRAIDACPERALSLKAIDTSMERE